MNTELFDNLLSEVRTTQDVRLYYDAVDSLIASLYTKKDIFELDMHHDVAYELRKSLLKAVDEGLIQKQNLETVEQFLYDLKVYMKKLPTIDIVLAYDPPRSHITRISDWIQATTKKRMILNLQLDSQLVAGMKINCNGFYKDLSLVKKIDAYFDTSASK